MSTSTAANNKRIAKNTLMLYVRMLLIMAVTLYTSRVVLQTLGVEDFGIYNVVAGVAISFVFFSSSLSNATQRFLNFELGRGDISKVNEVFCLSLLIYVFLSLLVLIVAIPLGTWLINCKLVIPEERLEAAFWVFLAMLCSWVFTLVGTVFDSVLIARENMTVYAYISIVEAVLKLLIVFTLNWVDFDKLKLYGILLLAVHIIVKMITVLICVWKYPECRFRYYWNSVLFRKMFSFVGWNGFGTAVWMINEQGMNILLNLFFGPIVNASRAIAAQVNAAVNNFTNSFFTAVRPQIVKSYATGDNIYFIQLILGSSRYSFFLFCLLCLPIFMRVDYILQLWLGSVPKYSSEFVCWILLYSSVNVLTNPLWSAIQAVGKLKKYVLLGSLVYLMAFPISYVLLYFGYEPVIVFQVLTIVRLTYLFVIITIVRSYIFFSVYRYLMEVIWPILKVGVLTFVLVYEINRCFPQDFFSLIVVCLISVVITLILIYFVGLSGNERSLILQKIRLKK